MADNPTGAERRVRIVALGLQVAAEAGWLTVLYAAAAVLVGRQAPELGPIELGLLVALGVLIARVGRRQPELGALALILGVIAGGVGGWLVSDQARSLLGSPLAALDVHLAGWLGAFAVLRGALLAGGDTVARQLEGSMRVVPVVLALVWAYVTIIAGRELWLPFAVTAIWGTVVYFAAVLPAIGWTRLQVLHANVSDERRRRNWRMLVTAAGIGAIIVAVPVVVLTGIPLGDLLEPVVGPFQWLVGLLAIPLSWIIWLLFEVLRPFAGPLFDGLSDIGRRFGQLRPEEGVQPDSFVELISNGIAFLLVTMTVILVLGAIFLFARWLVTRAGRGDLADEFEPGVERAIVVPPAAAKRRPDRLQPRRRVVPRDAVTAYLSALRELESHPPYERRDSETPAGHGLRMRLAGMPAAGAFGRLVAGYQLARYADRPISRNEDARALTRLQRIKRALRR